MHHAESETMDYPPIETLEPDVLCSVTGGFWARQQQAFNRGAESWERSGWSPTVGGALWVAGDIARQAVRMSPKEVPEAHRRFSRFL